MRRATAVCLAALLLCACSAYAGTETGTVTASALVLRAGPGLAYEMLGELPQGAVLTLSSYENGWYHVTYGSQTGYVHARYVRVALPTAAGRWASPGPAPTYAAPPDLAMPALTFTGENNPGYPRVLKPGDMGNSVIDLQRTLARFGYAVEEDGQYGYDTQAAVMKLQMAMGIDPDGIVGQQTRQLIGGSGAGGVELLDWWYGGNVAYARLTEATIVDMRTGLRFAVSRYGGDNHCDAEPLTMADTATLLTIAGGAWSHTPRPVWLEVGGRVVAASMSCMPREGEHIQDNGFDGHFCIHLFASHGHDADRVDEAHAASVLEAYQGREAYSAP